MAIKSGQSSTSLKLARLREGKGLTLQDIAESTKISLRFLQAIEAEDFGQLPGGIFSTSYIRQYAGAIGYEASSLLATYNACTAASTSLESHSASELEKRSALGWLLHALRG
jgi:cytoskeletal protein RodZ